MSNQENEFNLLADEAQKWLIEKVFYQKSTAIATAIVPIFDLKDGPSSYPVEDPSPRPLTACTKKTESFCINKYDVLPKRHLHYHPGNVRYRKLVHFSVSAFFMGDPKQKYAVVQNIYELVVNDGGRFFKQGRKGFQKMSRSAALNKIRTALQSKLRLCQEKQAVQRFNVAILPPQGP
ncbi:hypothetical protein FisN_13Hu262 [Fistulifera solaris]|uniref:DUF6824 domain-containing protein n=1 Tax=Fistulifera solaris TaxID=1519565 RepID=A0A1Z5KMY2_FISSO|nr:hypothetical protein FisN_13Hu262 [Fistulifera solaris]|eukprot:GAX27646.1 hypothetical protein FisN_13Hu262 [Fistulifera solaris]